MSLFPPTQDSDFLEMKWLASHPHIVSARLVSYTLNHLSVTYSTKHWSSLRLRHLKWKSRNILRLFLFYFFSLFPSKTKESWWWWNKKRGKLNIFKSKYYAMSYILISYILSAFPSNWKLSTSWKYMELLSLIFLLVLMSETWRANIHLWII